MPTFKDINTLTLLTTITGNEKLPISDTQYILSNQLKGQKGDIGPAGNNGDKGDPGIQGPVGPQGPRGDTGTTGSQGPRGYDGSDGSNGLTGPQGPKGDKGDVGATGARGNSGSTGATGATGPAGRDGVDAVFNSSTSYTLSGTNTFTAYDFITSSDRRLKQNIKSMPSERLIDKIQFKEFTFISDESSRLRSGFIAQEVEEVAPQFVYTDKKDNKSISIGDIHTKLIFDCYELIKFQQEQINELRGEILAMKGDNYGNK